MTGKSKLSETAVIAFTVYWPLFAVYNRPISVCQLTIQLHDITQRVDIVIILINRRITNYT